jgi:thiamine-monophosphate kinase
MPLSEFALIDRYFRDCGARRSDVPVGIGDDAALLVCPPGKQLVAAIDTLVEGVHFPVGSPPASIGHRALAVNLSDLAAMGAEPAWALLALTLREARDEWLAEFSRGLGSLAREHNVALVGGDTTSGPLTITIQVLGFVEPSRALRRSGAQPGDVVFVSGTPGDAAGGLAYELKTDQGDGPASISALPASIAALRNRFLFPTPRVALGRSLLEFASACIDVSDGLLGDAGKLAHASGCAVELDYSTIPLSTALTDAFGEQRARELALSGGDDYELCFTVPPSRIDAMRAALPLGRWSYTPIGVIKAGTGARVIHNGTVMDFSHSGYDHFSASR